MTRLGLTVLIGLLSSAIVIVLPGAVIADEIHATFDGGVLDTESFTTEEPPGFSVTLADDEAQFTKDSGTGNGFARITTVFTIKGDFDVSVVADRLTAGPGTAIGIVASHLKAGGFDDVFFDDAGNIVSFFFVPPLNDGKSVPDSSSPATFRIRRVGDKIFHEYEAGAGLVSLGSNEGSFLAGPVQIGLFLGEQNGSVESRAASFDDFFVQGDEFTPPCGNGVLQDDELCDDDDPDWTQGEGCNATCEPLPCGDTDDSGTITVVDALFVLRTSVGTKSCDICVCDVDSNTSTTVSDALQVLRKSVGQQVELTCQPCG